MRRQLIKARQRLQILHARFAARFAGGSVEAPVFMVGCGRSGKSTLAHALALHPDLAFLDESRVLWIACFPHADIWTEQAGDRTGRLHLHRGDVENTAADAFSALLYREMKKSGKPKVMQALAANSFRMDFLHAAFPKAKFIHVSRNGLNVAQEIAQRADQQGWWGNNGYKWKQLQQYAARTPDTASALALCENNFDRGLLEWRLSIEAIEAVRPILPANLFLEIRYEEMIDRPREQLQRAREFIGLPYDAAWERRALALMRRPPTVPRTTARQKDLSIGGTVLTSRLI